MLCCRTSNNLIVLKFCNFCFIHLKSLASIFERKHTLCFTSIFQIANNFSQLIYFGYLTGIHENNMKFILKTIFRYSKFFFVNFGFLPMYFGYSWLIYSMSVSYLEKKSVSRKHILGHRFKFHFAN